MNKSVSSISNNNKDRTYLPGWYEVDFVVSPYNPRDLLKLIFDLISDLKVNLITMWFFLYEHYSKNSKEEGAVRLRYCTKKPKDVTNAINEFKSKNNLQILAVHEELFSKYYESKKDFPDEEVLETFVNIMYEISRLTIKKLNNPNKFSNFKLVERISHCVYNNVYGLPAEAYYLFKRLNFNFKYEDREEDPEHTILDDNNELLSLEYNNLGFKINVPFKKQKR